MHEPPSLLINGNWRSGRGEAFASHDPATGAVVWRGRAADARDVHDAFAAARGAAGPWARTPLDRRAQILRAMSDRLRASRDELALAISAQVGKPLWDALGEVDATIAKADIAIEAHAARCATLHAAAPAPGVEAQARFRPHGVAAVLGPFNFPAHLPHGHIAPALLAGNAVVFKPSEKAPGVGALVARLWLEAGLPPGVLNLVQGSRDVGAAIVDSSGLDALCFTGSVPAGLALRRALVDRPGVVLALEMGGNNPLVVWEAGDLDAAADLIIRSAYLTSGQRCTCARRLILPRDASGDAILERLATQIDRLIVGPHTLRPEPFMGPLIDAASADALRAAQADLLAHGGVALRRLDDPPPPGHPAPPPGVRREAFLRPGLIDVTAIADRPDVEHFGPLLQVVRVSDFDAAIEEANRTRMGLAAGLVSDRPNLFDRFLDHVRAGVVNWNRPLTNASSRLPFGGLGLSGNHRPSGFLAADYCAFPVATLSTPRALPPEAPVPGLTRPG